MGKLQSTSTVKTCFDMRSPDLLDKVTGANRRTALSFLALAALLVGGCHSEAGRVTYQGGDGSSDRLAVVIKGPADETTGVSAEWAWVEQRYPGCHRGQRALISLGATQYDLVALTAADGQVRRVWFDITDFYRKL
jgi:hypothetical protein